MVIVAIFFECFVRAINCISLLFYYFLNFFSIYIFVRVFDSMLLSFFIIIYVYKEDSFIGLFLIYLTL